MNIEKKNIFLSNTNQSLDYSSSSKRVDTKIPMRADVNRHANFISRKLAECYRQSVTQKQVAAIRYKEGVYLEFSSSPGYDLIYKSLESISQGIRLSNIKMDEETNTTKAIIYIPEGKETYFYKKIEEYTTKQTKKGNPKNADLINSIEDIKLALLESFWIGDLNDIPTIHPCWCEIWIRIDNRDELNSIKLSFEQCCKTLNICVKPDIIKFPERAVMVVNANMENLKKLISAFPFIAEFRRAPEPNSFFEESSHLEQSEWIDDLLKRTTFHHSDSSICILDTGLNFKHPLVEPAIKNEESIQCVNLPWGTNDHDGHGTEMAGIAIYNNLKAALESPNQVDIFHTIESVKILPPKSANEPELYGSITNNAVLLSEINNPSDNRSLCMAVTAPQYTIPDGSPSSWSASLDSIISGAEENDAKRLFFVSAGNVQPHELMQVHYPNANILHSVENPGQSWNAITVGAYSNDIEITNPVFKNFSPIADVGELSPYSSTSVTWSNKWPIKPEIVFDGGNMVTNGSDFSECEDLTLLTTSYKFLNNNFSYIWGTSAATAQASWMSAQLYAAYPEAWPETIRALLIHSAQWTNSMKRQFCDDENKKSDIRNLLRTCGYGIPNLQKAIQCVNNSVNLVIQDELQPYRDKSMNEMHIHKIPWPNDVLRSLGETDATIRITLSYYIEPGPGEIGWKDKYRYSSCGLRFDLINSNETLSDFQKRINVKMRGDDKKDKGDGSSRSWYLGVTNRDVGSIHSDFCQTSAIDLCDANYVAIYPVVGWWRERTHLKKSDSKIRYSLLVSIETPSVSADLYTPIVTQIETEISHSIEIPY